MFASSVGRPLVEEWEPPLAFGGTSGGWLTAPQVNGARRMCNLGLDSGEGGLATLRTSSGPLRAVRLTRL